MDWTDDRLQERFDSIDHRFDEVDRRLGRVEQDLRDLRSEMSQMRSEMNHRFDGMQRAMVQGALILSGSFIAGFAALIALIATKL